MKEKSGATSGAAIAIFQRGFTLIEIAIVLVIVGLLLGGVLQGQQLIENSRVRAAVNHIKAIPVAANSYMDRYGRFPGDDGPAADLIARGGLWSTFPQTANGNTNGVLDGAVPQIFAPTGELQGFWSALKASGFLTGSPATLGAAALPQNPFGGLIGVAGTAAIINQMPSGLKLCMNNVPGPAASVLDTRLDDGLPNQGNLRASAGVVPVNGNTVTVYGDGAAYTICIGI